MTLKLIIMKIVMDYIETREMNCWNYVKKNQT